MSTFVLKRKTFATILANGDNIVSGANAGARSQSYYDDLAKQWGDKSTENLIKENKGVKIGSDSGTRNLGGNTTYNKAPKMTTEQVAKTSFNNGAKSTGILGGVKNTYAKAGNLGKAGMIGAGVIGAGLMAKGAADMIGSKKRKNR